LKDELEADLHLSYDMSRDPNSLNYFSDERPMANILKRFNVQIELWKNVLNLRQGKFYSRTDNYNNPDDSIMGLHKVLAAYENTLYDSPDLYQIQDEGTILRKLLAVFSLRPTFTQISSISGFSNVGAVSRATFIRTPICNVKLPNPDIQKYAIPSATPAEKTVKLSASLSNSDWFIENKMFVPKFKQVISSDKIIFFYVNRRYQAPITDMTDNMNFGFSYLALPSAMTGMTKINPTEVVMEREISINGSTSPFVLSSVVVLNPLIQGQIAAGCSTIVVGNSGNNFYYNPVLPTILVKETGDNYIRNPPISTVGVTHTNPNEISLQTAQLYGTVFVYVNQVEDNKVGIAPIS